MTMLVVVGLYLLALVIRLIAAEQIPFPTTEPSAYYVDVARNLVGGEGLVSNGVWSFATPPLEVPKPAFELWLPMATFASAIPMALLGSTYGAAQIGGAVLGAFVAPLAWAIGREAARTHGLDARRGRAVAVASGLLAAVLSPLVLGAAVPDSYTPFTIFVLAGALVLPRALGVRDGRDTETSPRILASLGLGLAMGLAYLSRQEVIWLGLTVLLLTWWVVRGHQAGTRLREAAARLWPVVAGGLIVVVPWLIRNELELGSFFPGQAVENMFLVQNEDIFAFNDRPEAATYFGQGLATVVLNPLVAIVDTFVSVLAFTAFPVGIVGLLALVGMRRSPALRRPTALLAVLICSGLTFVSTMLLFPVATLWGTFLHASGPLLVGLIVVSALGGDALLARISRFRGWARPNVVLAPVALVGVAALLGIFQLQVFASQAEHVRDEYAAIGEQLQDVADARGRTAPPTVISDHPMWMAGAIDGQAVALPDEPLPSLLELSALFDAPWVVVVDERGRYPEALLAETARGCLVSEPTPLDASDEPAWLFELDPACRPT
jgi:hypothetical protein